MTSNTPHPFTPPPKFPKAANRLGRKACPHHRRLQLAAPGHSTPPNHPYKVPTQKLGADLPVASLLGNEPIQMHVLATLLGKVKPLHRHRRDISPEQKLKTSMLSVAQTGKATNIWASVFGQRGADACACAEAVKSLTGEPPLSPARGSESNQPYASWLGSKSLALSSQMAPSCHICTYQVARKRAPREGG